MKLTSLFSKILKNRSVEDQFYDALREKVDTYHGLQRDMARDLGLTKSLVNYYVKSAKVMPDNVATYIINYKK